MVWDIGLHLIQFGWYYERRHLMCLCLQVRYLCLFIAVRSQPHSKCFVGLGMVYLLEGSWDGVGAWGQWNEGLTLGDCLGVSTGMPLLLQKSRRYRHCVSSNAPPEQCSNRTHVCAMVCSLLMRLDKVQGCGRCASFRPFCLSSTNASKYLSTVRVPSGDWKTIPYWIRLRRELSSIVLNVSLMEGEVPLPWPVPKSNSVAMLLMNNSNIPKEAF